MARFGVQPAPYPGEGIPLERQLADAAPIWAEIARKHDLIEPDLNVLLLVSTPLAPPLPDDRLEAAGQEFHTRVARASHNAAIVMLADSFHGPTLRSLQHVKDDHPEMGIRGSREHRQFVVAIKKRDVEKAIAVMRTHIGRTARHVSKTK